MTSSGIPTASGSVTSAPQHSAAPALTDLNSAEAPPEAGKRTGHRKPGSAEASAAYVILTGNPNCGKTTVFNALTGLRAKVANYPGVTVERKEGLMRDTPAKTTVRVLDLPGTYSLSPQSIDEQISRDVLFHHLSGEDPPDLVVVVVDLL